MLEQVYDDNREPVDYPSNDERVKVAEYVYNEYEDLRREIGDLELDLLNIIKVDAASDRFDMIFLATLFSGWTMKEERAYSIWKNLIESFKNTDKCLYSYLVNQKTPQFDLLKEYDVPPKISRNIWETARNLRKYDGDFEGLKVEGSWTRTLENIGTQCKGVKQKAFWVARIMRQKGAWDISGQYCCVSDSHNKAFLKKMGFISFEDDLYNNSRIMWRYFNEPFEHKYYDLPVFRFARTHGCKKCSYKKCNLKTISNCK